MCSIKGEIATTYILPHETKQYLFNMSPLEVFRVQSGVGVDVSKFFEVGAGVESESETCDSAHP